MSHEPTNALEALIGILGAEHADQASMVAAVLQGAGQLEADVLRQGIRRIQREQTVGPLLRPSMYLDGRRDRNGDDWVQVLTRLVSLADLVASLRERAAAAGGAS